MRKLLPPLNPITVKDYYTSKNQALTRSKVEDFLADPHYFYLKHIEKSIQEEPNDAMKKGSIIDAIFSNVKVPFSPRVLKRDDAELYAYQKEHPETTVSQGVYDEAVKLGLHIREQPFYKWYDRHQALFQAPLQASYNGVDIAGLADVISFDDHTGTVYIDDLKSTQHSNVKNARAWWYKCKEAGYFRQLGLYRTLAKFTYPEYKQFTCRHVVATTDMRNIPRVALFELEVRDLEQGSEEFFHGVDRIMTIDNFDPVSTSWEDIVLLSP